MLSGTQSSNDPIHQHTMQFRVRYAECDSMGVAHHGAYPVWFEMGRTELYRLDGCSYRALEDAGVYLAVVKLDIHYRASARYDELLTLHTKLVHHTRVKLEHEYELSRDGLLLTTAHTTLGCLGRDGRPRPLPAELRPGSCDTTA